jgi:hypothetical protein
MDLRDEVVRFFDPDGDGLARFSEWPFTVDQDPLPSAYYATLDTLVKLLLRPGFEKERPKLFEALMGLERRGDREEVEGIVQRMLDVSRANPLVDVAGQPAAPGFIERFDLDGDGAVDGQEYPELERLLPRCDRNGDGVVSGKDGT